MKRQNIIIGLLVLILAMGIAFIGCDNDPESNAVFTVTIDEALSNGTITADPTSGTEGTEITLTVTPSVGYFLKPGTLKHGTTAINETTKKFLLPASNVIVTAEFDSDPATYTVTIDGSLSNGSITADPTSGLVSTEITLTVTPATGYVLKPGTLKYGATAINETTKKFLLPASNVTVTAEFELEPNPFSDTTWVGTVTNPENGDMLGKEIIFYFENDTDWYSTVPELGGYGQGGTYTYLGNTATAEISKIRNSADDEWRPYILGSDGEETELDIVLTGNTISLMGETFTRQEE